MAAAARISKLPARFSFAECLQKIADFATGMAAKCGIPDIFDPFTTARTAVSHPCNPEFK
ncbi:MAG: hypothetical protein P8O10_01870 [Pseudorhodobacter sp.]|nr:hypothetical protein [Pseudorhodobacter sp.]